MVHKLPEPEGEARGRGLFMDHKSLATALYLLYSLSDWFFGSIATSNMATLAIVVLSASVVYSQAMALCSATCLGMPEWTECCEQNSRFASILTDEEAKKLAVGYTPKKRTNGQSITSRSGGSGVMSTAPKTQFLPVPSFFRRETPTS